MAERVEKLRRRRSKVKGKEIQISLFKGMLKSEFHLPKDKRKKNRLTRIEGDLTRETQRIQGKRFLFNSQPEIVTI